MSPFESIPNLGKLIVVKEAFPLPNVVFLPLLFSKILDLPFCYRQSFLSLTSRGHPHT